MAGKKRDKGKSHPTRPVRVGPTKWVRYSPDEIGALAAELARMGYMPSVIGIILRDQYGIPLVKSVTGMKLTKLLEKYGVKHPIPEDLLRLMARAVNLRKHLNEHPKDTASLRGLIEIESKIKSLIKYYKRVGRLPQDFEYSPSKAEIWVSQYLGTGVAATIQQALQQQSVQEAQ
uniref:Small ribosomal subunit protein uS15 n=1 Tax=Ignisphaera aggregans TaxID=334771 RepID=A0A7C2VGW9_9CREN